MNQRHNEWKAPLRCFTDQTKSHIDEKYHKLLLQHLWQEPFCLGHLSFFPKGPVCVPQTPRQDGAIKPSGFSGNQRGFFSANWHCVNWTWIILLFMRTSAFCPSCVSQLFACVPVLHGHLFLSLFWTAEIIKHKNYSFLLPSGCILMVCQLQGKICQVKPPDDLGSDHPYLP